MDDEKKTFLKENIWQHNFITFGRYEMSSLEKNILYSVIGQVKRKNALNHTYLVSVRELCAVNNEKIHYEHLKKATNKLLSRVIEGTLENGNLLQVNFISHAEYLKNQGIISIGLSPKILPFFLDLQKNFTTFNLEMALTLKSIYSKRIYEMINMYKNFMNKTVILDIEKFKISLDIINKDTLKDKYPTYTLLKKNVLDVALNEINRSTDISFTYKPIEGSKQGKGRKPITKIEFTIIHITPKKIISFGSSEDIPMLNRLIEEFKLRRDQASHVLANFSLKKINEILYSIIIEKHNKKVRNMGAYTAARFELIVTKKYPV